MSAGALQLKGCLKRIYLEKRRNIRITCCECFSHLIIIFILVLGYNQSKLLKYDDQIYTVIDVKVPPIKSTIYNSFTSNYRSNNAYYQKGNGTSLYDTGQELTDLYYQYIKGPLIVPTLDQYLSVSEAIGNNFQNLGAIGNLLSKTGFGRTFTNLIYKGDMHFAPEGEYVNSLIKFMNETYPRFKSLKVHIHKSEKQGVNYILNHLDNTALALIVLRQITPQKVNYVIRQNYTTLPNSNLIIESISTGLFTEYQTYILSGFMSLQKAVDTWAFKYTNAIYSETNSKVSQECTGAPEVVVVPYPTLAYQANPFYLQVGFLLGLAMVMATLYPVSRLVKSVVEEKELKLREIMKIMGLKDWVHQLSWFLSAFVLFFWIAVTCTLIAKASFLKKSSVILLFFYFFLFTISEINFAFLISVFFSNSKLAAIVGPVVLFTAILPRFIFLQTNNNEEVVGKVIASFLSPTAFAFGADIIARFEYGEVGVQFSNIQQGKYSFSTVLFMMWADFYIYGFLAWYFDQIVPHEYGTVQHPLFLFDWYFWCPRSRFSTQRKTLLSESIENMPEFYENQNDKMEIISDVPNMNTTGVISATAQIHPRNKASILSSDKNCIENIPIEMRSSAKVRCASLRKRYPNGKLAVKDFSLSMLEGQITCLLGHNGAGKTTAISTLTGMIKATSGDVSIYGFSLSDDLPAIRQMTGICPQHNVLYPMLTVLEHLLFFGNVKGMYGSSLDQACDRIIADIGLTEKRHVLSSALSGGMKRKLSLAIALIGDPKFLLLDEPTSGMDPYSRRSTWELLQQCKKGRVVLLTTHFMEEADTLADRVVIMSEGVIRCSGSPLFLKTRFGVGYILSLSKTNQDVPIDKIESYIKHIVPSAMITSAVAGEVIFRLPLDAVPLFAQLFSMLRNSSSKLGINSYGISLTTLEQVFISLAQEEHSYRDSQVCEDYDDDHKDEWLYWLGEYIKTSIIDVFKIMNIVSNPDNKTRVSAIPTDEPSHLNSDNLQSSELRTSEEGLRTQEADNHNNYNSDNLLDETNNISVELDSTNKKPSTFASTGISKGTIHIQFYELLRKRYIIASRDLKGIFFLVLFPAIQILLIMLILTIDINPAGHTLTLNAELFPKEAGVTPSVVVTNGSSNVLPNSITIPNNLINLNNFNLSFLSTANLSYPGLQLQSGILTLNISQLNIGNFFENILKVLTNTSDGMVTINLPKSLTNAINNFNGTTLYINNTRSVYEENLSDKYMNLIHLDEQNSTKLSYYILNPIYFKDYRLGGYVFNDVIPLNLTVDWKWVKKNRKLFLDILVAFNLITVSESQNAIVTDIIVRSLPDKTLSYEILLPSRYTVMHNSTSPHGIAAYTGELTQTAYKTCSSSTAYETPIEYLIKNHPLPITLSNTIEIEVILALLTSLFILVPLCYIPASFVSFLVKERVSKSKHLQIVSSVSPYLYWFATYTWDMFLYSILTLFILAAFFAFGNSAKVFISTPESTLCLLALLFTYGLSCIPLSYFYSLYFDNYSTAQISIMVLNFLTGFVFVLAYYVMISIPQTKHLGEVLVNLFRFFPPYNIGEGLINLSATYYYNEILGERRMYFAWSVTGRNIAFMTLEAIGYFSIILLTEFSLLRNFFYMIDRFRVANTTVPPPLHGKLDEDVIIEQDRVAKIDINLINSHNNNHYLISNPPSNLNESINHSNNVPSSVGNNVEEDEIHNNLEYGEDQNAASLTCSLLIRNLIKTYPSSLFGGTPKYAVRGISLGCYDGERFGLLGINGAGKTTTLSILTGDFQPTSGEVFISGKPLSDPATMSMIGYCPQVDPLLDLMNGYETLWFFGRIRGIPIDILDARIKKLIKQVGLQRFALKPCGTYSGGNKRKLSLAVALIGDPKVLLLDEPSTGMDPEARRNMWNVIEQVSAHRSVILVSHSMEEVEALCTRMGVMVSGRLQCLGTAQHLKNRFGMGYQVEIRCLVTRADDCITLFKTIVPLATIDEVHGGYIRFKVQVDFDLAHAFQKLETAKSSYDIFDYSISQCTLEQIFIQFAKEQEEEKNQVGGGVYESMQVPIVINDDVDNRKNNEVPYVPLNANEPAYVMDNVDSTSMVVGIINRSDSSSDNMVITENYNSIEYNSSEEKKGNETP